MLAEAAGKAAFVGVIIDIHEENDFITCILPCQEL
jgi:hypothetical protein